MRLATARQMREMDQRAIDGGVPSLELMERAAQELAQTAMEMVEEAEAPAGKYLYLPDATGVAMSGEETATYTKQGGPHQYRTAVFCGPGNNGGDGLACARLLKEAGWEVRAFQIRERPPATDSAKEMAHRLQEVGVELEVIAPTDPKQIAYCLSCDLLVDALFGVGLRRPLEGDALAAVAMMNSSGVPVLAVDMPSGVETDTGRVMNGAVNAACTVTFTMPKVGQFVGAGAVKAGKVQVVPIGITDTAHDDSGVQTTEPGRLPRRERDSYKGMYGKLYIMGGSVGFTGAPVLAAEGALRSGAGLVHLAVPARVYPMVASHCLEAMPAPLPADSRSAVTKAESCDVMLLGPGMGGENRMKRVVLTFLEAVDRPAVLDADGLNAVAGHIDVLKGRKSLTVLTPHDGEFQRLGGDLTDKDRLGAARAFAQESGCVVVLKGYRTLTVFPDGEAFVNTTGNPGMSTGGSGDVLGGMIASLLGQRIEPKRAIPLAVYLHGRAGDLAARELGEYGMLPRDLIQKIPYAMKELE